MKPSQFNKRKDLTSSAKEELLMRISPGRLFQSLRRQSIHAVQRLASRAPAAGTPQTGTLKGT